MKKEFLPYYISRAILSCIVAVFVMSVNWKAVLLAIMIFGFFLLYLHSGWFNIDLRQPFTPLRRDHRGEEIQRKALISALVVGMLVYLISSYLFGFIGLSFSGNIAFPIGVITYFMTQFVLFVRT